MCIPITTFIGTLLIIIIITIHSRVHLSPTIKRKTGLSSTYTFIEFPNSVEFANQFCVLACNQYSLLLAIIAVVTGTDKDTDQLTKIHLPQTITTTTPRWLSAQVILLFLFPSRNQDEQISSAAQRWASQQNSLFNIPLPRRANTPFPMSVWRLQRNRV